MLSNYSAFHKFKILQTLAAANNQPLLQQLRYRHWPFEELQHLALGCLCLKPQRLLLDQGKKELLHVYHLNFKGDYMSTSCLWYVALATTTDATQLLANSGKNFVKLCAPPVRIN